MLRGFFDFTNTYFLGFQKKSLQILEIEVVIILITRF